MSSSPTSKILRSTDGTTIFAEATGDPGNLHLVLLSGLALSGCVFDGMCADQRLLESLYIVRYDLRGHGRSGQPNTPEAYTSKLFADDFKTVMDVFGLNKPVLAGWSMGATVATDVVTHLPPGTISGIIYLAGVPGTGVAPEMVAPALLELFPAFLSDQSVIAYQIATAVVTDRLFAHPETVPYAVKAFYLGQRLTPAIMGFSLSRAMDMDSLWKAGQDGLPLLVIEGTEDGHRGGSAKNVDEVMRPHFKNYENVWLEGRGHALHYESPDEIVELLITFTKKVGGKRNSSGIEPSLGINLWKS
ncbi:alpha/beta-hydrolase [Mycena metata]|uniref:Alpha/beta-hydrolase n=1 Tax=Mycena metata TaxID=1033252 RepID=A0AAD7IM21_9AGAR|nr:alpha/beta-hydrolase [Mycena metata]